MEKLLEVGDILYNSPLHGNMLPNRKAVIDRITPKRAFAGAVQFKRELNSWSGYNVVGEYRGWQLENEELKAQFEAYEKECLYDSATRKICNKLNNTRWRDIDPEILRSINALIPQ